jgi:drug/metabolite transporter (DMT)-like permease
MKNAIITLKQLIIAKDKRLIGILLLMVSTLLFTTSSTFLKLASEEINSFHLMFWRSLVGLIIVISVGIKKKRLRSSFKELNSKRTFWLILRGVAGGFTMFCLFTALTLGDLSEVGALNKLSPIPAVIFAYFILKEDLNRKVWFAVIIAVVGVFFIRNPFVDKLELAHILVLMSAVGAGFVRNVVRRLKLLGLDSWMIVLALLTTSFLISLPNVLTDITFYSLDTFMFMIGAGLASTLGQLLTTSASKYLPTRVIAILGLLVVFEFMIVGSLVFGEIMTIYKVIGAILIMISSSLTILFSISTKVKIDK